MNRKATERPVGGVGTAQHQRGQATHPALQPSEAEPAIAHFGPAEIRCHLQQILDSPAFEASERRRRLLRYVVEQTLDGRTERLEGAVIATEVFGRDQTFDPQSDPVVRLEAGLLRRALASYYLTDGRHDPVRIAIPKGACTPQFQLQTAQNGASPAWTPCLSTSMTGRL
jgi:hypothetical protein